MIDFPANPTLGEEFTAAGITWTWDGTKWTATGQPSDFLPLTGGSLSGNLTIDSPDGNNLNLNAAGTNWPGVKFNIAAGKGAWLRSYVGANERWEIDLGNGIAESGGNSGSNFQIVRYSDAGAYIDDPLVINRQSGVVFLSNLSAPQAMGDNRIINGDMRIDQRGVASGGGTANGYTVDRWQFQASLVGNGFWERIASAAPGFPYYLNFTSSSAYASLAADFFFFQQPIEADAVSDFAWGTANAQPVTLSFWVYSSLSGTFSGCVKNYAATRSYPFTFSVLTANSWTKITITIPGDTGGTWVLSGNGGALYVVFDLGSGSTYRGPTGAWASANYQGATGAVSVVGTNGAAWGVTGVKLEIGSVATPYNRQSLAKTLADCQRYYQTGWLYMTGYQAAGQSMQTIVNLSGVMRAAPTAVILANGSGNISGLSLGVANNAVFNTCAATTTGTATVSCTFSASAEL